MFGQRIDQEERNKCLSYLQEEMKLIAFRDLEQRLFDEVFIQYYGQEPDKKGDLPREALLNAAQRIVEAAKEIIRRRQRITSVPDIASAMFYAYKKRFEDYLVLKEMQADTMTRLTPEPGTEDLLEECMIEEKKSLEIAQKEEKKLWELLKLRDSEVMEMWNDTVAAVKSENWEPS